MEKPEQIPKQTFPKLRITKNDNEHRELKKLKCLGYFSLDGERKFCADSSRLSYVYVKYQKSKLDNIKLNLNIGYNNEANVRKHPLFAEVEKLDHILTYLKHNLHNLVYKPLKLLNTDFIAYRGALRQIMGTIYEKQDGWFINASYYKGNIYLCAEKTEKGRQRELEANDRERLMCSWGYKFEQFLLTSDPKIEPNVTAPINESEEFNCVFSAKIGRNKLLYCAEVDAVASGTPIDIDERLENVEFIELKTAKHLSSPRQESNFRRFKSFKFWSQSYLVGIKRLMVGFRDDDGIVDSIETMYVDQLPNQAINWTPNAAINFLNSFLDHVYEVVFKANLKTISPFTVWRFEFSPFTENRNNITVQLHEGPNQYSFLRDWYIEKGEMITKDLKLE